MLVVLAAFFFTASFCVLLREAKMRGRQYEEHGLAAYFKTDFGQIYVIRSSEVFIGAGQNADIRIRIPGVDRKKNRWWGKTKLAGIAQIHAHALIKEDGQFYIRNLSDRFPVYMEFGDERKAIRTKDGEIKMYHGARYIFGGCALTFSRGVV